MENNNNYLIHYGILGMKWGVRRYQNADGSLKSAGKKRYSNDKKEQKQLKKQEKARAKELKKSLKEETNNYYNVSGQYSGEWEKTTQAKSLLKNYNKAYNAYFNSDDDDPALEEAFCKAEESLLKAEGEYVYKKLLEHYGVEKLAYLENNSPYWKTSYTVDQYKNSKRFVQDYYETHRE